MAWKQLASTLGLPAMPPAHLAGNIRELPLPRYRYDTALAHILSNHTDVITAINGIEKARFNLRLAEVTPVPDIAADWASSATNRNRGLTGLAATSRSRCPCRCLTSIKAPFARPGLHFFTPMKSRTVCADDLTARTADAYRRYSENFELLELYHKEILPKQVQAYRSAVQRHSGGEVGAVGFLDLVNAEQNLVTAIGTYLTTLQS